jgi:hypothetical protein
MSTTAVRPLDPTAFPKTYRPTTGWLFVLVSFGAIAVVAGGAGTWYFAADATMPSATWAAAFSICSSALLLLGLYVIVDALKSRVNLYADAIEIIDLRPARRLRREEIAGYRFLPGSQLPRTLLLIPHRADQKKLKLPLVMRTDHAFHAWFENFRNLDAEELEKSEADIAADPQLGATIAERLQRLSRARKVVGALNAVAILTIPWAWFWPEPYELVVTILVILPWLALAIVAASRGLYRLDEARNDARPSVDAAFILPAILLGWRAFADVNVVEWHLPVAAASIGGLVFAALAWLADRSVRRRWTTLAVIPFGIAYAYGVIMLGDALLDREPPRVFRATVVDKYVSSGKSKTLELRLAPWGPVLEEHTIVASRSLYDGVGPGGVVCAYLRPGALRIAWYVVAQCR